MRLTSLPINRICRYGLSSRLFPAFSCGGRGVVLLAELEVDDARLAFPERTSL
jgi:hypothetical protein